MFLTRQNVLDQVRGVVVGFQARIRRRMSGMNEVGIEISWVRSAPVCVAGRSPGWSVNSLFFGGLRCVHPPYGSAFHKNPDRERAGPNVGTG